MKISNTKEEITMHTHTIYTPHICTYIQTLLKVKKKYFISLKAINKRMKKQVTDWKRHYHMNIRKVLILIPYKELLQNIKY